MVGTTVRARRNMKRKGHLQLVKDGLTRDELIRENARKLKQAGYSFQIDVFEMWMLALPYDECVKTLKDNKKLVLLG